METKKNILDFIKVNKEASVDQAYFEQFSAKMLQEIKKHPRKKVFYLKPIFWMISSAAAIIFFFFLIDFKNKEIPEISKLKNEEIKHYIQENQEDAHLDELAKLNIETPSKKEILQEKHATTDDKNIEIASLENFVSSEEILNEISTDELYYFMNSDDFDLDELEITSLNN